VRPTTPLSGRRLALARTCCSIMTKGLGEGKWICEWL
jgi:hypothetical protein